MTQPTGTSPLSPAARASSSAISMNDAMVRCDPLCYHGAELWMKTAPRHKAGERIAKAIARAGLASRREAEEWIAAGRVTVNGAAIRSPALQHHRHDQVTVDGEPLPGRERTRLFLYYKPRGLMTTHADPQGRPTIFQRLPKTLPRLISIGRLDFNTEGLLLLTNDGALARVLELPATGWLRRYRVRAHGTVTQKELDDLRSGITVSGIRYGAIEANTRARAGLKPLAYLRDPRGQEPRGTQRLGTSDLPSRVSFACRSVRSSSANLKKAGSKKCPRAFCVNNLARAPRFPARISPHRLRPRERCLKHQDTRNSKTRKPVSHSWRAREEGSQQTAAAHFPWRTPQRRAHRRSAASRNTCGTF